MNRSYWLDGETWRDPDCIECGGEGAACCEPPDEPSPFPCVRIRWCEHGHWEALDVYWDVAKGLVWPVEVLSSLDPPPPVE